MIRRFKFIVTVLSVFALVLVSLSTPQISSAQNVVVGEATGVSVSVSNDWVHNAEASTSDGTVDSMVFERGNANFVVTAGTTDLGVAASLMPLPATTTDIDVAVSYALLQADSYGVFSVAVSGNVQTLIAPGASFAEAMAAAQSGIQIDGGTVMSGVDGGALASSYTASDADVPLLAADEGSALSEESTEEAASEATQETTESDSDPTEAAAAESGLEDENSWVSPQFGTTVSWTDDWTVHLNDDGSPMIGSMEGVDYLVLAAVDGEGDARTAILVAEVDLEGFDREHIENLLSQPSPFWDGDDYFGVEVSDTGYFAGYHNGDGSQAVYEMRETASGVDLVVDAHGSLETLPDMVAAAQVGIQIDEVPVFEGVDTEELRDVTDGIIEQKGFASSQPAEPSAESSKFKSEISACEVSWSGSLGFEQEDIWVFSDKENTYHLALLDETVTEEAFSIKSSLAEAHVSIKCISPVADADMLMDWQAALEPMNEYVVVVPGDDAKISVNVWSDGSYEVNVIVDTVPGTAVIVRWTLTGAELDALISANNPPQLVVNGVDIIQVLDDHGIREYLP